MRLKINIKKIFILMILSVFALNFSICFADDQIQEPSIIAEAAVLMESSSEKILYSKNHTEKMYPASTTKIMTAILTIEKCNLNDIVTVPYEAISIIPSGYSVAALQAGEQLTVEQLLQLMMVHSANDAANVLAFHISGDIDTFASLMNNKVKELGLENTHFTNPSGMHDENHYTTAYDLAIIMKYCMKNPTFRSIAKLKYCKIPATNKYEERVFDTTNELLIVDNRNVASNYYYQYAIAGKTGYTTEAKNCLISVSDKDGFELISVVLGCGLYENGLSAKFIDSKTLFEYGYNNYAIKKLREKDAIGAEIQVSKATKNTKSLDLLLENDIYVVIPQSDLDTEFEPEIIIDENLTAPISINQVVGKITYKIDDLEYSSNLLASHSVEKSNFIALLIRIILIVIVLYILYRLLFGNNSKKKYHKKKSKKRNYSSQRYQ